MEEVRQYTYKELVIPFEINDVRYADEEEEAVILKTLAQEIQTFEKEK